MKHVRKRLSYANVMSSIAVFLTIGGATAVAATQLPANSVGPRQLQANAVQTGFIARSAVRTGKIAPEAVRAGKLAKDAVPTNRLRENAVTAPKLANGAVIAGKLGKVNTQTTSGSVAAKGVGTFTVSCQPGEVLLSGGADWNRTGQNQVLQIAESSLSAPNTWRVTGNNTTDAAVTLNVHAYCLGA